ncbi:MAG: glycosyltransferase family 4 protein [bacterium]
MTNTLNITGKTARRIKTDMSCQTQDRPAIGKAVIIVENMSVPADRRVWQEATSLAKAGWDISVICPKAPDSEASYEVLEGVSIYRHSLPFEASGLAAYILEYGVAILMEIWLLLRIGVTKLDIVQICNPPDFLFVPAVIAKIFGAKIVFDHHDLTPELLAEKKGGNNKALLKFAKWAERRTFASADRVISTNDMFADLAKTRGGKNANQVDVVFSSPDLHRLPKVTPNPALKQGKKDLLLWVGMIGSQDGVDLTLDALAYLRDVLGYRDFHMLIVGDGPQRVALINYAEKLGLRDWVTFTGFMTGPPLHEAFSTATLGIGSDPKNEFNDKLAMNKVMEYMAYGLPIAMFDLTQSHKIAGPAAAIAENNDPAALAKKIAYLLDNPEEARGMGQAGAERLREQYGWAQQEKTYLRVYKDLLEGTA